MNVAKEKKVEEDDDYEQKYTEVIKTKRKLQKKQKVQRTEEKRSSKKKKNETKSERSFEITSEDVFVCDG